MELLLAVLVASALPVSAASVLTGVSVGAGGGRLALSGPVQFRAFRLSDPERFVVDLLDTEFGIPERRWPGAGQVTRLRAGPWGETGALARVVFDLSTVLDAVAREVAGAVIVELHSPRKPGLPVQEDAPAPADLRDALTPAILPPAMTLGHLPVGFGMPSLLAIEAKPDQAHLRLDRPSAADIFFAANPPRLVIDLPGVILAAQAPMPPATGGIVKGVRVGPFKAADQAVTRVVLDLARTAPYRVERSGAQLTVIFEPEAAPTSRASRTREWRGWIVDAAGRPLSGVFLVRFSVPDEGSLSSERWTESLYVDASGGRFSAVLGRQKPLPEDALDPGFPLDAAAPSGLSWRVVPR